MLAPILYFLIFYAIAVGGVQILPRALQKRKHETWAAASGLASCGGIVLLLFTALNISGSLLVVGALLDTVVCLIIGVACLGKDVRETLKRSG